MAETGGLKSMRLLEIYSLLQEGKLLKKAELAQNFNVTPKSIQRDIEDLRCFFAERGLNQDIIYDTRQRGYRLTNTIPRGLNNSEVLAVCKILLESRSLRRDEMIPILDKLLDCAVPEDSRKAVKALIANEQLHYLEPHHGQHILSGLWEIGQAIKNQQVMEIQYNRMKEPNLVTRRVQPVGIMFSEYYFYLTAFLENKEHFENPEDLFPTIYRIDRIHSFKVLDEHFRIPYAGRFEEGEFRKRVQFMYGGKLERIKFRYTGPSLEAVLDRLPTAKVIEQDENGWLISAEVFGKGVDMWMRSQGHHISLVLNENCLLNKERE